MRVVNVIKLFDMLQHVEIYPILNPKYNGEFYYEENQAEDRPIFAGRIKDIPFWMLECILDETAKEYGEGIIDCRAGCPDGPGGTTLVFCIKEPKGV